MPPKPKEAVKKPALQIARPPISDSSLLFVPEDAIEGANNTVTSCETI